MHKKFIPAILACCFIAQLCDDTFVGNQTIEFVQGEESTGVMRWAGTIFSFLPDIFMMMILYFYLNARTEASTTAFRSRAPSVDSIDSITFLEDAQRLGRLKKSSNLSNDSNTTNSNLASQQSLNTDDDDNDCIVVLGLDESEVSVTHNWVHELKHVFVDVLSIFAPFTMLGIGAYIDFEKDTGLSDLISKSVNNEAKLTIKILGSGFVGFFAGYAAYIIHSTNVHKTMNEHGHGGHGIWAFIKAVVENFKPTSVAEAYRNLGLILGHIFAGYYAAEAFTSAIGVDDIKEVSIPIQAIMAILVTMIEGNSEVNAVKEMLRQRADITFSAHKMSRSKRVFGWIAGFIHSLSSVLGGALLIEKLIGTQVELVETWQHALMLAGSAALTLYPNMLGFENMIEAANQIAQEDKDNKIVNERTPLTFATIQYGTH